jgi:hypothetical protein
MCCVYYIPGQKDLRSGDPGHLAFDGDGELTPAQDYAGEVLAYLLQVVVGYAGPPENRADWHTTGIEIPLDYKRISKIMTHPGFRKSDLISFDTSVLGLVAVLYHYNPRLNLFKGRYVFDSIYPSSELIALRLLILRKLKKGEKVSLTAMLQREPLFRSGSESPSAADLAAINLSADEFQLLKDVFISDPHLFQYYKHPFVVEALTRLGFFRKENLTEGMYRRASYNDFFHNTCSGDNGKGQVKVAVLGSLTSDFDFGGIYTDPYVFGFKPTATYLQKLEKLKTEIMAQTARYLRAEMSYKNPVEALNENSWQKLWIQKYCPLISFQLYDQKPFSIYPENVDRVVREICPSADFVIILLGKDVYRAMHIDTAMTDTPITRRLFLDIADIDYLQANEKIDKIARFITTQLKPF